MLQLSKQLPANAATATLLRRSVRQTGSVVLLFVNLLAGVAAQETRHPLPDVASVREIEFSAPGCGTVISRERQMIERAITILSSLDGDWLHRAEAPYGEFVFKFDTIKEKRIVIRAGRVGEKAFLQTAATSGGFYVRDITFSELSSLLEVFHRDTSVALLLSDKGRYRQIIDGALISLNNRVRKEIDADATRGLLESILQYARSNPQDTTTSTALRTLLSFSVDDFIQGWYVVRLEGCGYHCSARVLVRGNGKAVSACAQNCLSLCWDQFGTLDKRENAERVCQKVLEGSGMGKIIGTAADIPGYQKKPLPKGKEREIRPMHELRVDGQLAYGFYVYEQLGGRVWQCTLMVEGAKSTWQMSEIAKDIGAAGYIL